MKTACFTMQNKDYMCNKNGHAPVPGAKLIIYIYINSMDIYSPRPTAQKVGE